MGTLFAGIIRAPMTSVFMIFEITQDYQIIVPLMVANLLSFVISRRYQPIPVYEALLRQDGIHLPSVPARDGTGWTARDMMHVDPPFLAANSSIDAAVDAMRMHDRPASLVGTPEQLLGIVTREGLARACAADRGAETVLAVLDERVVHVHPDHPLDVVLERFAASGGLLPVVSRAAVQCVEGAISLDDLVAPRKRRSSITTGPPAPHG
jgi:CIC family chloride channel protein